MPIKFFDETPTSGDRLFAVDYLKKYPKENGKQYDVISIKLVNSGKGYLVETDKFMGFIWKNSKSTVQMIEALRVYVDSGNGYTLVTQLDKLQKNGMLIGVDFDRPTTWFQVKNDSFSTVAEFISPEDNQERNPYLPEKSTVP